MKRGVAYRVSFRAWPTHGEAIWFILCLTGDDYSGVSRGALIG